MNTEQAFNELIQDIHNYAGLSAQEATGFYAIHCPVCHKTSKKTGGFKFEDDSIIYNCFRGRCNASCVYKLGEPISYKFKHLMSSVGVTIPVQLRAVKSSFQKKMQEALDSSLFVKHSYSDISDHLDEIGDCCEYEFGLDDFWDRELIRRAIPLNDILFCYNGQYDGCIVLPVVWYGRVVGFQIVTKKGHYISYNVGNSHVIYSPTGGCPTGTVLCVEGTMDAKCFPSTVGIFGDKITPQQAYQLRGRDVVFLPDRSGGNKFIKQYTDYGWKICIPPWEEKDLNAAVMRYGVIAVARMIRENIYSVKDSTKADLAFRLWSE